MTGRPPSVPFSELEPMPAETRISPRKQRLAGAVLGGHPPAAILAGFAHGEVEQHEACWVVAHLLGGCRRCRTLVLAAGGLPGNSSGAAEPTPYALAFERAKSAARRKTVELAREEQASRQAVPRLASLPRARQWLLVRNSRHLRSVALCEALWSESLADGRTVPERMVDLAELALGVAFELEKERYGDGLITDLRARAAAEMANVLRLAGKLQAARETMAAALELVENGTGDPLLRARIYDLAASLFPGEEADGIAPRLLERAFHLYRRFGDRHQAGRVLLKRAIAAAGEAEPTGRLELLVQAADLIDPQRDRWLAWASIHSMLWGLVELERFRAAAELLEESRELYAEFSDRIDRRWLSRLEGRIAAGLSDSKRAEEKLLAAYEEATAAGDLHHALLVAMDLADLMLRQDRAMEARVLIEDLLQAVRGARLGEELTSALGLLREHLERPEDALSLVEEVSKILGRCEGPGEVGFEADR